MVVVWLGWDMKATWLGLREDHADVMLILRSSVTSLISL